MSGEQPFEKVQPGEVDFAAIERLIDEKPWSYHDVEASGRIKRRYAITVSRNSVELPGPSNGPAVLFLKIEKHVGEASVVEIGLMNSFASSAIFEETEIYMSLDGGSPRVFHAEVVTEGKHQSLFVIDPSDMIFSLKTAAYVQITVPVKDVGLASFDFKVEGFKWEE